MKTFYLITALTLLAFSNSTFAQQYYKWVDKNGSTHYTTTPPPKGAKRLDKVSTYGASSTTSESFSKDKEDAMPSQTIDNESEAAPPIQKLQAPSESSAKAIKTRPNL